VLGRTRQILLGLGADSSLVDLSLLVNPSAGPDAVPVVLGEVATLVVDNMSMRQGVDLVKVEEGDHWVAVVFGVEVGIPEDGADENVGADRTSVP
jgi:hypothetical protein